MSSAFSLVRQEKHEHNFLVARPHVIAEDTPMVFVHGMSGFAAYLVDLMEYFARRGRICYAPDIVGHGERHRDDLVGVSVRDYIADVDDFIEKVVVPAHGQGFIVVGHSMGGLISAKLAERPDVTHAILVTPAPPKGVLFMPGGFIRFTWTDLLSVVRMGIAGEQFVPSRKMFESLFADPDASKEVIDLWTTRRISNESLLAALELGTSSIHVEREKITAALLVIGAAKDVIIHPRVSSRIAEFFRADFHMLETLGHMCPFEAGWEATAVVIEEWLNRNKK